MVFFYKTDILEIESTNFFEDFLSRFDILVSALLAIVALKMSVAQKNMQEFEFCEKIGFHEFKNSFDIKQVQFKDIFVYEEMRKNFTSHCKIKDYLHRLTSKDEIKGDIYDLTFTLKDQMLNPQLKYSLHNVRIYNSRKNASDFDINKIYRKNIRASSDVQYFGIVGFKSEIKKDDTNIHILVENVYKSSFLQYLKEPEIYNRDNCENFSLLISFKINDINKRTFKKKKLVVLICLSKDEEKRNFNIVDTQSFAC